MAAFDFPSSPAVGDIYALNGVTFRWNGYAWGGGPIVDSDAFVMKAGDTMVGNLTIATPSSVPVLTLNKNAAGIAARLKGQTAGVDRWDVDLGNSAAESGSNVGSDFQIQRRDDAGVVVDQPFKIDRSTGKTIIPYFAPSFGLAHRGGGGNVALGTATWTKVNMGTLANNYNGALLGNYSLASQRLQVPRSGAYLLGASALIQTTTVVTAILHGIGINSDTVPTIIWRGQNAAANNWQYSNPCVRPYVLNANDQLTLMAYSAAAGSNVLDTSTETYLWAQYLGA